MNNLEHLLSNGQSNNLQKDWYMNTKWKVTGENVNTACFRDSGARVLYFADQNTDELHFAITPWEKGFELYRKVGFDWVADSFTPEVIMVQSKGMKMVHSEIIKFSECIPQDIADIVGRFEHRQIPLLRALKVSQIAKDINTESPVLLWKLASHLYDSSTPIEKINAFEGVKRLQVIKLIYGPLPKSSLRAIDRFMKKIIVDQAGSNEMRAMDVAINSPATLKRMNSLNKISFDMLISLLSHPEYLSCP